MRAALLDVNVLVALAWPNHVHHEPAHTWFAEGRRRGWATCPLTESGFVRVSSNPRLSLEARQPREAIELLRRIISLPDHIFLEDATTLTSSPHVAREKLTGYRQVTDAHLLAIALQHGVTLVTFDRGLRSLLPSTIESDRAVETLALSS